MADYWTNPGAADGRPVIRHAPTTHGYHFPSSDQLSKVGSPVGRYATIPQANNDGTSKGFNPNVAGPMHVDPDAPDGGVIFDPATVDRNVLARAVHDSEFAHQAFYRVGVPAHGAGLGQGGRPLAEPAEEERSNPAMPNHYVVPAATSTGRQTYQEPSVNNLPPLSALPNLPPMPAQQAAAMQPQPVQYSQSPQQPMYPQPPQQAAPQYYIQPPAMPYLQPDPSLAALLQQMSTGLQSINQRLSQVETAAAAPPPAPAPVRPPLPIGRAPVLRTMPGADNPPHEEEDARPIANPTNSQVGSRSRRGNGLVENTPEPPRRETPHGGEINGFESLEIQFLGPVAQKPRYEVIFRTAYGQHQARYHAVVTAPKVIVLVYDTRFEDGFQYIPNDGEEPITITVDKKNVYEVSSVGQNFNLGVLDMIVLVRAGVDAPPPE